MIIFVVVALIVVVVIFGVSSGMQSYASAQQAQATIETARAAQMAIFGNIVIILLVSVFLISILALFVYSIYCIRTRRLPEKSDPRFNVVKTIIERPRTRMAPYLVETPRLSLPATDDYLSIESIEAEEDELWNAFEKEGRL